MRAGQVILKKKHLKDLSGITMFPEDIILRYGVKNAHYDDDFWPVEVVGFY